VAPLFPPIRPSMMGISHESRFFTSLFLFFVQEPIRDDPCGVPHNPTSNQINRRQHHKIPPPVIPQRAIAREEAGS
jgi:hypothetical protein